MVYGTTIAQAQAWAAPPLGTLALMLRIGLAAAALCAVTGCASAPAARSSVSVDEVVAMSRQGVDAPTIIGRLQRADAVFRLSGSQVAALEAQGVAGSVLDYLVETELSAVRKAAIDRCYGRQFGYVEQ